MLYKYSGNIGSFSITKPGDVSIADIIIRCSDRSVAPTRLQACGGLADYIHVLEMTDDAERYIEWNFFYDSSLMLAYIEIPAYDGHYRPAKVLTGIIPRGMCGFDFRIFGNPEHITTDQPEAMSSEEYAAWRSYRNKNLL